MARGDIKRIFRDHFEQFVSKHKKIIRPVVIKEVKKMLDCGKIENVYLEYKCVKCGERKKVAFRCRSRFCNSCGRMYTEARADSMASKLVKTGHRHMVFTIPKELRDYFRKNRKMLEILPKCTAEVLKSWFYEQNKGEAYMPRIVAVIHTFGRDLKWNLHVHILVTKGASGKTKEWKPIKYVPYNMLRLRWQKILLDEVEKVVGKRNFRAIKNRLYKEKNNGFYVYGKGEVENGRQAIRYVGRYTGRPVMAESRIIKYDGKQVTFWYERHEDGKRVEETIDAEEFIKRMIIHIPDEQFRMIRYYGIYTTQNKKGKNLIKMINEKIIELKNKMRNWRMQIMKSFGEDPLECEKCGGKMELYDVYYKKYGSMLELYKIRIEAKYKKEIEETKEMYNVIKKVTNDRIEPVFV